MKRCPITYQPIESGCYSKEGLRFLSPRLKSLGHLPYSRDRQLELMLEFSDKLSFSGVQPKLSARLDFTHGHFKIVRSGTFILKLPHARYPELPQNEDLTMKLAAIAGIAVPKHGLLYDTEGSLFYFIERIDRAGRIKTQMTDFGQLLGLHRDRKYDSSLEKVGQVVDAYCTFPHLEKVKLFRQVLFGFLIGNEDMHVKNFSLVTHDKMTECSPAYDLVNSTIVTKSKEETALPLAGKKSKLSASDWIEYFGKERLSLPPSAINAVLQDFQTAFPKWKVLIGISFLSEPLKTAYLQLVEHRMKRLFQ